MNLSKQSHLIAEELGWTDIKETGRLDGQLNGRNPIPVLGERHEVPVYPRSLGACEEILNHFADKHFEMNLHLRNDEWSVSMSDDIETDDKIGSVCVVRDSLPAAICECFLRLCGKWEEK